MRLAPGEKEGRARSRFPQHTRERRERRARKAFEISFSISLKNDFAASGEDGGWGMGKRRRRRSCIYAAAATARELVGWEGINIGSCFGLGGGKGLVGWGSTRTNGEGLWEDRGGISDIQNRGREVARQAEASCYLRREAGGGMYNTERRRPFSA